MLGHESKSETTDVLRLWVKNHQLEAFNQLIIWDVDEFTDHGALSSYMEK